MAAEELRLSAAVEHLISTISGEKAVPPPDASAKQTLAEIGEDEALDVLKTVRNSISVRNFSGFIIHLVKNRKTNKRNRSLSPHISPQTLTLSPPCCGGDFGSPASATGDRAGDALTPNKRRRTLNFCDEVVASMVQHFTGQSTGSEAVANTSKDDIIAADAASVLDAFAELEFRKAFLILNYSGGEKLEKLITAEKIRSLSRLDMNIFEVHIWNEFGRSKCKEKNERRKYLDWESGKNLTYHCHINGDGSYSFKGPFFNKTTTLLQKTIGDENVLIVKLFEEQTENSVSRSGSGFISAMTCTAYNKIAEEGIFIGRKRYQFFVFKDGGKEEKKKNPTSSPVKCYFISMEGFARFFGDQKKTIQDARSVFMHVHKASTVANYMARFSLILSKTVTLNVNLDHVTVQDIGDVLCLDDEGKPVEKDVDKFHIHTDGTGFISEDLALRCPTNCFMGLAPNEDDINRFLGAVPHADVLSELSQLKSLNPEPALLIQFRMFHQGRAIKGTVLLNRKLPPNTIQVRPSMIKIAADEELAGAPTLNRFEIVGTSNKPKKPRLSKNLIALLHYGGVPKEYFMDRLEDALKEVQGVLYKKRAALKAAISRDVDEDLTVARMILSGLPLDEPFLQHRLSEIAREERKNLKAGRIPINNSFYVMGTADPTNTLNSGEVCVILEHGQISGPVLVYRNPGIHFGDVHVVNARYVKALEEIVGNAKYGIFFPAKGPRSMADEIAGGDYDGDTYWVSRDPELLAKFRPSAPWIGCPSSLTSSSKKVTGLQADALERELFRLFLKSRFQPSHAMGVAADCWLMYMDRLLTLDDECSAEKDCVIQKIKKLIDKYYDALDAPKKGIKIEVPPQLMPDKFPHHMERGHSAYRSKSILGEIYDKVNEYNTTDAVKVWKLPYFEEQIKQIPAARLEAWQMFFYKYRKEMTAAMNAGHESKNDSAVAVYRLYKRKLYGIGPNDEADELDKSRKSWEEIRSEALAVYDAAYECAIQEDDPQKCNFAWKVAGSALFKIFMEEQGEKPIRCAPSVLREVFT